MTKSKYTKKELEQYILIEGLSYEEIGRHYGITGAAIKKAAKRYCIPLESRRKISEKEDFSHGGSSYSLISCLCCAKEFRYSPKHSQFCSHRCEKEYQYQQYIKTWKANLISDTDKKSFTVSKYIRRYFFEKYNHKCQICGWGEVNSFTNKVPLQLHHIDGDCYNNQESNLQILCPNCHSLTENFGSRNKSGNHNRSIYFGRG